ncbi:ABC-F family ATP-binding cassette domain-containing protein [Chitinophaga ginsengisegetis]|uniref:ABC-F family ATP-binding cassette domain-containing protein n=1 Tax=Chitinophaga ginsengisegetis TaxID=393003 RepID=UPI000DBAC1FD|nr:ABC-F family ATP-binding cassette domain-containing protein [Chitinophaga ginsengisegetis]MDR6566566.1 ATP-binding cassette subfamily F protein uup [Chitinophaga ginsengisegetis]MDR6646296.1 ATP-binding cassette subfamily F protein uup [Chitinophaga ginsengisegetis]MDR6651111.1 ATP-binding cassette subfamily F protein uup [Chitinophaga ginsengisegetis]
MHYVTVEGLTKSFGTKPLFKDISFHIEEGDKIALVALNGTGKSTLLRILCSKDTPDSGKVWIHKDVTVVMLEQQSSFDLSKTVIENIFNHNNPVLNAIKEYELLTEEGHEPDLDKLTDAITKMDEFNAWHFDSKVKQILGKLNIYNLDQPVGSLSGGQQKRVALAKVLIEIGFEHKHVLLIMDEPTNHLDVSMIEWLENYLDQENVTLLLVTHDRYFLDSVCNEIMELDREQLFIYKGDYENYLEKKAAREESEKSSVDKARNLYRKELEWMRKQPKARTTKSKSRQDAFYEVKEKANTKVAEQQLELNVKMTRLGGKILELKKVYKSFGDLKILKGMDYTFKKGERVGIVGKNGVGKSTFLNMLLGTEQPDSGKINVGETIVFGNYSQSGLVVKEDMRVIEFVKNIAENFPLADGTKVSAAQFLELFLFPAEKQYTYISKLSGGEKRRLHLLSILFRNPNFLVLDEPTNDLDLPTLSILENFLQEFQGCVIVVSHDRYFMDKLVEHLFVFEGNGEIRDFPGNYTQYREWEKEEDKRKIAAPKKESTPEPVTPPVTADGKSRKMSFKEKRELELLEKEIEQLETEKKNIETSLSSGELSFDKMEPMTHRIGEIIQLLDEKGIRWLELSEMSE